VNCQAHITQPHHTCPQIIQILILFPTNATKDAHELIINNALKHLQNSSFFLEQGCILILPLNAQIFIAHWIWREIQPYKPLPLPSKTGWLCILKSMKYMDEHVAFVENFKIQLLRGSFLSVCWASLGQPLIMTWNHSDKLSSQTSKLIYQH
jgi:hypothetical protein